MKDMVDLLRHTPYCRIHFNKVGNYVCSGSICFMYRRTIQVFFMKMYRYAALDPLTLSSQSETGVQQFVR
jgi:hypothetical protein